MISAAAVLLIAAILIFCHEKQIPNTIGRARK